ncbi:MAG: SDR family oxidoreductase [Thaumarchaeota archaeon]|nr:SDR family oxidoreductase [Nitrososphaerota archaeon]
MPTQLGRPLITGKRVLVTAASRGLGFGAAETFLEAGARVVINSSNPERLAEAGKQLSKKGEVHPVAADLTREKDLDRLVAETTRILGGIDSLVYVTGSPPAGTFLQKGYSEWREAAELMTVSPAYIARLVALDMIEGKVKGNMVFLGSITMREPVLNLATSGVCRIAVSGLVRTLARELGPRGIRVNGILPGYIDTDRTKGIVKERASKESITLEKALADLEGQIPIGRLGTAREVAQVALFLASDLASYVSGALVPVDGAYLRSTG